MLYLVDNEKTGELTRQVAGILRAQMARYTVNQTELSESVGISQSQLSKMLRGLRPITVDQLDAICDALGLDIERVIDEATAVVRPTDYESGARVIFVEEGFRRDPVTNVTPLRADVSAVSDDDLYLLDRAAGTDESDPREDDAD